MDVARFLRDLEYRGTSWPLSLVLALICTFPHLLASVTLVVLCLDRITACSWGDIRFLSSRGDHCVQRKPYIEVVASIPVDKNSSTKREVANLT
jgi:hypothetical protein